VIHVSQKHRVVGVPFDPRVANIFPTARRVTLKGNELLVVPHGMDETRFLRNLGHDIPAPILSQYDWCGGKPYEVQRRTCAMLTTSRRAFVLNGLGTGKTRCAVWSFDYLRSVGLATRALVVAPLSTLNFTWKREVFMVAPHLSVGVLHGDKKRRLRTLAEDHDIYVINHDGIKVIEKELREREGLDMMIVDELATYRNGTAARSKCAQRIAKGMDWVWGMTGTPMPNEPTDAWGQCMVVNPELVDKRMTRFRDEVMVKVTQFKWVPKRDATETVFRTMQPAVRYSLDDVVELPQLVVRAQEVESGPKQLKVYDTMRVHAHSMVENKEITAANAGAVLNKLLQISLGYVYNSRREVVELDGLPRQQALLDAISSTDRKLICWVPYTHALNGIAERLEKEGIDYRIVDGSTSKSKREETFTLFQNTDKVKVLLAHPATASHGLTLTAADTIVWYGPTTSLETYEQANGRITRIGQKAKQQIILLWATGVERRLYARLRKKESVQRDLLSLFADASA